jgi:para-aminobenzoate synthetase component 1
MQELTRDLWGGGPDVPLGADELVGALLGLAPARGLHLLDSGGARGADARLLLAGFDPFETIEAYGDELHVYERRAAAPTIRRGSALSLLDARLAEMRAGGLAGGACVATLSYELARQFARLRTPPPARAGREPDAVLTFFDALVVHDYAEGRTFISAAAHARAEEMRAALLRAALDAREVFAEPGAATTEAASPNLFGDDSLTLPPGVSSNFTRAEYERAVERVRRHIYAGDIYQANLTQQLTCRAAPGATPERVFRRLRVQHPAAFAAFVRRRSDTVVSVSPERFLRVGPAGEGRAVEAWPIKGTRPRGRDAAEDARLRAELLASAKDRAENVMIVDLTRNDLGRVCRYGTVEVAELCALQEHPTLFHLVSKVRGLLREGVTAGDLLRAAFPCGSITGAPKLRAMEILDGLEPCARGLSMGSIGYFTPSGAADLNVAIRTVTFAPDGAARFHVGGGIVADSDPAAEYDESLVKARALLRALRG